ncbi:beta strand repeat-containing protein, partial [Singulisphaera rosea]
VKTGQGFSLTVSAKDASGDLDPNYSGLVTLSLAANPGYGMFGGTLTTQAVNGIATFTGLMLNEPASGYLIEASASGLSDATTSTITVTSAGPQLAITTQPTSVKTEQIFSLTVTAKDANGNFDPTYSGLITLSLVTNPGNGMLGGTLTAHAVNGVATFTGLTLNRMGVGYSIRASTSGLTDATSSAITVTPAATQLVITTPPPSSVNTAAAFSMTVTAEEAYGTIDLDYNGPITLSLAANPGDGMLSGKLTVNAVQGVATFTGLSLNKAAFGYQIKASASSLTAATTAIDVMPIATQLTFLGMSAATTMVNYSVTVRALDASGNFDPYYTGQVTISLYSNPSNGTLVGTLTAQTVNGIATFTGLTFNKAGVYRLQATAPGLSTANSPAFNVFPAATQLVITPPLPSSVKTGETFTLTVAAEDANGNLDPNYTGIVRIDLGMDPSDGMLSGTNIVQAVNGIATFTGLSLNKPGSGYVIRVWTTDPLRLVDSAPISVTPVTTQLAISTQPPSGVKSAADFSLTVTAEDANGNLDPNYWGPITLSLASNPGNGMLGGTLTLNAEHGVATFAYLTLNKSASGYLIKASASGLTAATSTPITVTPAATQLAITTQPPSSVKTGQTFSLVVNARDANGNLDPNYSGPITLSLATNSGNGMLNGPLTVNAVHGVATFTGLSLNRSASGYLIKASSSSLTTSTSTAITVTPAATQLAFTTQPPSSVKTAVTFTLTVSAQDANGNLDPNYSGPVTLSLATNPGNGMLSGTLTVNAVHGVATFTNLTLNRAASGYLIKASSSSLTTATSTSITVTPAATQLAITSQPPSSVMTAQGFSLTVTAKDSSGNLDPNYNGPITLSLATNPGNGMLSGTLTVNAVHGVATFTGLSLNRSASGYLIKASSSSLTASTSTAITVIPAATQLVFTTQPPSTVKIGVAFSLVVTAKDANGNVDSNYNGLITVGLAANPGNGMVSGTLSVQAVHGVATFTNLILNKPAVGYLIKATATGLTLATSSSITATTA